LLHPATAETLAYDGLSRLTEAQSGNHLTRHAYDSLSRRLSETTDGRTVTYEHDDAGNPTQQVYPSGTSLTQTFDALNRLEAVTTGAESQVAYGFRGSDLIASKSLGNGLSGGTTYDPARRPTHSTLGGASFEPFTERLSWSPRNLKTAIQREDLNGAGYLVAYDDAGRLIEAAKTENPLALAPNNSTPTAASVAALPDSFGFTYDAAENLLEQRPERFTISAHAASPPDASGRNRPGSFAGQPLAWDGNGNLVRKGPDHFAWDYRNRLTRVTRDGVGEIARYEYDAFNRLARRVVAGETQEWVWAGWQLLERYADGQLAMRRIYGQGLDEVVRQETDGNGDGLLETVTIPVYDSIGNAVAITDAAGKALERYEYAPYGTRTIRVDLTPPAVEQLREAGGTLLLELSEEILLQRVQEAIASGNLTLRDTTDDAPVAITASQPVRDGKQKGRRLLLTPDPGHPPQANHGMLLHIEPGAMVDLFENRPETAYERPFVWLDADHTIDDTTAPRVDLVITKAGELEISFSEEIDPQVASAVILLDGQARAWTALPDRYTLKPAGALSATTHTLQIGPALIDQAGNPMTEPFTRNVTTGAADQIAYERPDPRVTPTSTLDNLASFQGHITDPATGLVYMRNRWMDPEMGRFLSPDPMGFVDGPNTYSYAGNSPMQRGDPLGLYQADFHFGVTYLLSIRAGFSRLVAQKIAAATERPDQDGRSPVLSGVMARIGRETDKEQLREWHFPKELLDSGEVVPGSTYAWKKVKAGIASKNLEQFGEGLHPLQDSWSHQGVPSLKGGFAGHPEARGGLLSSKADIPVEYPDDALGACEATYKALLEFRDKGSQPGDLEKLPVPWTTVRVELRELISMRERKDKRAWLAGRGVSMPEAYWADVSMGPIEQKEQAEARARTKGPQ
jgi:RHS repeat-associated protein